MLMSIIRVNRRWKVSSSGEGIHFFILEIMFSVGRLLLYIFLLWCYFLIYEVECFIFMGNNVYMGLFGYI
jgi:hypothetical protein